MSFQPYNSKDKMTFKEILFNIIPIIILAIIFIFAIKNLVGDEEYITLLKITRVETEETKNTNEILYQLLKHCLDENNNILNRCK